MAKHEMLNNIAHGNLKVITKKSAAYGDDVGGALIFPSEFVDAQRDYPIFFQKEAQTGEFQAVAIFGFKKNENLFLDEQGWHANYIPAVIAREPFLIGFQREQDGDGASPVIHVDMDSPRISHGDDGEAVFLEHGGNSPYIENISRILMSIHDGLAESKAMFSAFLALDLIEPFVLDIEFNNGAKYQASAYYTINQEKFFALDDSAVGQLHKTGYLHFAYMVLASLGNIRKLIDMCNKRA
tara:strand:+ start:671 stop:1390 length:720 start_codon:yes stop_codon:yes gene_type:complete